MYPCIMTTKSRISLSEESSRPEYLSEDLASSYEESIAAMNSFIDISNVDPDVVDLCIYTVRLRHISVIFDMRRNQNF